MGKRKSARKPQQKRQPKLDTTFRCLNCDQENSVTVKLERDKGIGTLGCKKCAQTFQAKITRLDGAVDVYGEWVDACERVNRDRNKRIAEDDLFGSDDEGQAADSYARPPPRARARVASPPPPARASARDEYGVPEQLSDSGSEIDDF
ncbi:hypothetical protein H4R18_002855 [Coemansia javaensis]|uniref:Transcription elongation factor 1 homolog n=1 Tax=Coemansia javaensis TaxID=2761396 RepID=A0A9W8HBZ4_9FUNG|nr:hypothetical protein H4R18_002855 [Coemansia javaensis]